ncbi:MAG: acetyl-CoA carboxylase biotin carboxyl carrier protein [Pseudomonadota bacterium]|nr:acetyl-CoA carboxylase biotin carboxyl carrier protein [Pseudomonadota bacterium]
MDIRKVKKLIEMLENSNLDEIEIQEGEESVRLVKSNGNLQKIAPQSLVVPQENKQEIISEEAQSNEETKQDSNSINSPMVGTFYASASPGAKPFVSVGDMVSEGDVVCIVEAMKMMNEIKSEFSGKVLSINVENAEPVEYGQSLFELSK